MKKNIYIAITVRGTPEDIEYLMSRLGDLSYSENIVAMHIMDEKEFKREREGDYKLI